MSRLSTLRDAAAEARTRSTTHWYIDHGAGNLHITVTRAMEVPTDAFVPGFASYRKWTSAGTTLIVTCADAAEFATMAATAHIAITYAKPLTVIWVLPDGTTVSGAEINQTVPEGTTLAICDDWRYTAINMHDTGIIAQEYLTFPPILGVLRGHNFQGRFGDLPDYSGPMYYPKRTFLRASIRIKGTPTAPSRVRATTTELQAKVCPIWCGYRDVAYAPHITGSLGVFSGWKLQPGYNISSLDKVRQYPATYAFDGNGAPSSAVSRWASLETTYLSFHHCGVHGYPLAGKPTDSSEITDFMYYACPNATPKDYDDTIAVIMDRWWLGSYIATWVGDVWSGTASNLYVPTQTWSSSQSLLLGYSHTAGQRIIPACGTLTISNRTADPIERARRIALLRAAGWTVTEVDDSLETGIYRAAD